MTKKKALGADPLSWIRPTVEEDLDSRESDTESPSDVPADKQSQKIESGASSDTESTAASDSEVELTFQRESRNVPKFETYEVKLTLRLKEDQLEFLSRLEREIMKNRSSANRKERITKNSLIRGMVDTFRNLDIDTSEIGDEEELVKRLLQASGRKTRGNLPS